MKINQPRPRRFGSYSTRFIVREKAYFDEKPGILYFWEVPEHYKWNGKASIWERRLRGLHVIG